MLYMSDYKRRYTVNNTANLGYVPSFGTAADNYATLKNAICI